jgi:hypothetical protein
MGDPILEEVKRSFPKHQQLTVLSLIEEVMRIERIYRRFLCVLFFALGAISLKIVEWIIS